MGRLKSLKLFAFGIVALGSVLVADFAQAIAENFLAPEENRMHGLVNETRQAEGLAPVSNNDALRWMARRQAQTMVAQGFIFHTSDLASTADSEALPWRALGENVGRGESTDSIQRAFLASPTHLHNVVHPAFNALGVGILTDPQSIFYATQMYAGLESAPPPPPPPQPAPVQAPAPAPQEQPSAPEPTRPPDPPPAPDPIPDPDVATEAADTETDDTPEPEVTPRPAPTPERLSSADAGLPDERPSFLELMLAMLGRFVGKLFFWA